MAGFGRMMYSDGNVYAGDWRDNARNGYGVLTKKNGDYYEGCWLADLREGYGTFYFAATQKVIIGEWAADVPRASVMYKLDQEVRQEDSGLEKARTLNFQFRVQK